MHPGEKGQKLFGLEVLGASRFLPIEDGYQRLHREVGLSTDLLTGEVLASWDNPWSGESVEVIHIQNDPVNFPFTVDTQRGPYRVKFDDLGHTIGFHRQIPLRYPNPLPMAQYPKHTANDWYEAAELFNSFVTKVDLAVAQTQLAALQSSLQMMQDDAADSAALAQQIADLQDKLLRMDKQQAEVDSLQIEMAGLRQKNEALLDERNHISAELDAAALALLVPDSADDLARSEDDTEDDIQEDITAPTGDTATLPATESVDALPVDEFALGSKIKKGSVISNA